jgi:hypothetical protein
VLVLEKSGLRRLPAGEPRSEAAVPVPKAGEIPAALVLLKLYSHHPESTEALKGRRRSPSSAMIARKPSLTTAG